MPDFSRIGAGIVKAIESPSATKVGEGALAAEQAGAKFLEESIQLSKGKGAVQSDKVVTGASHTFDGKEAIPDVLRPTLPANSVFNEQRFTDAAKGYRQDIVNLKLLPHTEIGKAGDTAETVASRILKDRTALTGERFTPANIDKELAYITGANEPLKGLPNWEGQTIKTYDDARIKNIATDALMFKHVPPLGQFLKATGKVTEDDIQAAFAHQGTLPKDAPRRFLGQILEDKGLISAADANAAESTQKALKEFLKQTSTDLLP